MSPPPSPLSPIPPDTGPSFCTTGEIQRGANSGDARPACPVPAPCRPHQRCLWYLLVTPLAPRCARPIPTTAPLSPTPSHRRRRMEPPGRGSEDVAVSVDDSPGASSPRWASEPAPCQPLPLCLHHPAGPGLALLAAGCPWTSLLHLLIPALPKASRAGRVQGTEGSVHHPSLALGCADGQSHLGLLQGLLCSSWALLHVLEASLRQLRGLNCASEGRAWRAAPIPPWYPAVLMARAVWGWLTPSCRVSPGCPQACSAPPGPCSTSWSPHCAS